MQVDNLQQVAQVPGVRVPVLRAHASNASAVKHMPNYIVLDDMGQPLGSCDDPATAVQVGEQHDFCGVACYSTNLNAGCIQAHAAL